MSNYFTSDKCPDFALSDHKRRFEDEGMMGIAHFVSAQLADQEMIKAISRADGGVVVEEPLKDLNKIKEYSK